MKKSVIWLLSVLILVSNPKISKASYPVLRIWLGNNFGNFKGDLYMLNFDFQTLKNLCKRGRYTDPKQIGLHLWIKSEDKKYWILRNSTNGKQ